MKKSTMNNHINTLYLDCIKAEEIFKEGDIGFGGRTYVRSVAALIEADIHIQRIELAEIIAARSNLTGRWNFHLMSLLMDSAPRINERGKITLRRQEHTIIDLCKFVFKSFVELYGEPLNVFEGTGWDDFRKLIKVRNRITHPKVDEDTSISSNDINTAKSVLTWYLDSFKEVNRIRKEFNSFPRGENELTIPWLD